MRERIGFVLLCIVVAVTACNRKPAAPAERYDLKGKVVSVDKRLGTVTISHEDIPNLMDAMTMPFKLKDTWAFDELAVGDNITATLVIEGRDSWIEGVVFTRQTVDPMNPSGATQFAEPKPGEEVPNFALVNQDGKRIALHQFRGQVLLLTFIYTRCPLPDYCPLMTANFGLIEQALRAEPALYPQTQLLSISVDPDYDKPQVLRQYGLETADAAGAELFKRWQFASGTTEEIKKVAGYFGLQYVKDNDQINHSLQTAIIGTDGKLVKLYRGNDWKPAAVLNDLKTLRVEKPQ